MPLPRTSGIAIRAITESATIALTLGGRSHSVRTMCGPDRFSTLVPHYRRPDASSKETLMARTVSVRWIKGMKAEATIGPHRVVLDAPAEAGGGDEGPSPAEMLLGAIGA